MVGCLAGGTRGDKILQVSPTAGNGGSELTAQAQSQGKNISFQLNYPQFGKVNITKLNVSVEKCNMGLVESYGSRIANGKSLECIQISCKMIETTIGRGYIKADLACDQEIPSGKEYKIGVELTGTIPKNDVVESVGGFCMAADGGKEIGESYICTPKYRIVAEKN